MKKRSTWNERIVKHIRRTWRNKLCAIALFILGMLSILVCWDATAFVFLMFFAVPLFFAKENRVCRKPKG